LSSDANLLKRQAAESAVAFIKPGMVVGLGAGSTALQAIVYISELLKEGTLHDIVGVPCSEKVAADAQRLGVPLTTLEDHPVVDLTIDGADEADPQLRVIKGGGGALLREKIVAQATRRQVIIVDQSKLSPVLGMQWALPVEVIPFGWRTQLNFLDQLGAKVSLRKNTAGETFYTDQGNLILDCNFGPIPNPEGLAAALEHRTGIVEHGLFLGLVSDLIIAGTDGITHRRASL
jgi:ribose 5-phosphate isomerase A